MYLLDTHTLIWAFFESSNLSESAKNIISDGDEIFVSIVSFWEIAIKQSIGKLNLKQSITDLSCMCEKNKLEILQIKPDHLDNIIKLPDIHRDPFDRLLIAQAMAEGLTFITKDTKIDQYDIRTLW